MTRLCIAIDGVSKTYRDRAGRTVGALAGVSFTVEAEEFVALLGPSGCGKSMLLNVIAGLLAPRGGAVHFEREQPAGRALSAMVFQEFALFPWPTPTG